MKVWRQYQPSIHQPPSPFTAAAKEKSTEMVEAKYNHLYLCSRCKRKRITNNYSLPDDILFKILVHLCAKDIYDTARFVCPEWYNMIYTRNFIHQHLQHAPHGLLFHSLTADSLYVTMRQGRVEISKFIRFKMDTWSSCNGLILDLDFAHSYDFTHTFNVVNHITNQMFVLPPCVDIQPVTTGRHYIIAYAAACMEYKVVSAYDVSLPLEGGFMFCHVLTVGVDKSWRTIRGPHLTETDLLHIKLARPMMTQGFIHWFGDDGDILSFNAETEIITRNHRPKTILRRPISVGAQLVFEYCLHPVTYLETGGRLLSSLIMCGELLWEVWEMKPDSGEWRKLFDIDLEDDKPNERDYGHLVPIGWLNYPEFLVFRLSKIPNLVFLYNLVDGTFDKLELHPLGMPYMSYPLVMPYMSHNAFHYNVFHHQNSLSLLWLAR